MGPFSGRPFLTASARGLSGPVQAAGGAERLGLLGTTCRPRPHSRGPGQGLCLWKKTWGTEAAGLGDVVIWCVVQETWAPVDGPLLQASASSGPGTREVPRTQKLNPGGKEEDKVGSDSHLVSRVPCGSPSSSLVMGGPTVLNSKNIRTSPEGHS